MKYKILFYSAIILFFGSCVLFLRPVPILPEADNKIYEGFVERIYEVGEYDVVFVLKDTPSRFYINRGAEHGRLNVEDLKTKLIGNKVTIKYPEYWTPLDWNQESIHLAKLEFNGETIYTELTE